MTKSQKKYLFAIYCIKSEGKAVKSSEVSKMLGVTKASMVKMSGKLAEEGYIIKEPYREIQLTQKGIQAANELFTPALILQNFLENNLTLDKKSAKENSISMVTVLSEECVEKFVNFAISTKK